MRKLSAHFFLIALLSAPASAAPPAGSDFKDIPLITTDSYDPREEDGRGFKKFFSGIGVRIAGPSTDLKKVILEKLNQGDLRPYFPDARERDAIARRIANQMHNGYLSRGYSNANLLAAQRYSTNELISTVVKRVLKTEGVEDEDRSQAWATKILAPFNRCMASARAYTEGKKCGPPLEADILTNMGMAMSYEMSRQNFGEKYAKPRIADYKKCVRPGQANANNRVKDCALQTLRTSALEASRKQIFDIAHEKVPGSAEKVLGKVMPKFESCVKGAKDKPGFSRCADTLVTATATEIVSESILADTRLKGYFPKNEDRENLANRAVDSFSRCMSDNQKANRRAKNGMLETANCELSVKQETTKMVAYEVLRTSLEKNMPRATPAEREVLLADVGESFDRCWDSSKPEKANAPCMRQAIMHLALAAAEDRIARDLPKDVQAANPTLRATLLKEFDSCLDKRLPANILEATNVEAQAEGCASNLMRTATLTVAEQKVRAALTAISGELPDKAEMDNLVDVFVRTDFVKCLGENPNEATINKCGLSLQKNIAMEVAKALLPFKVAEFFSAAGGLEAFGLDDKKHDELLQGVLDGHKQCLKKTVKSIDSTESEQQVNNCFKNTVRDLALRVGPLEFERAAKENRINTKDASFKAMHTQFSTDLAACLDEKRGKDFPVDEYMKGMDSCQAKLTKAFTIRVAKAELEKNIKTVLSEASSVPVREEMQKKLFAAFDSCMEKTIDLKSRDACVAKLRVDATSLLVRAAVRQRALKELALKEVPDEVKAFETDLDRCLGEKKPIEACGKTYVKSSTLWLGKAALRNKLKKELGEEYGKLEADILRLETDFGICVNNADGAIDQNLLEQLEGCGKTLTNTAFNFVIERASEGESVALLPAILPVAAAAKVPDPISEKALAEMLSRTLLCLNGQLSPENQDALEHLDPESMEAELLKLIGAYVSYDLKNARGNYEEVLKQVSTELKAAGPEAARRKLLAALVSKGMIDQLMKSMVRGEIEKSIKAMPGERKLPAELEKALLNKNTVEKALSPATMDKLRPFLANGVLEPVVIGGKTLKSSQVLKAVRMVKAMAMYEILRSPELSKWQDEASLSLINEALIKD